MERIENEGRKSLLMEAGNSGKMQTMENQTRGISGSTLKLIALVTMLIDHIGAVVLWRMILTLSYGGTILGGAWQPEIGKLLDVYNAMRLIGRIAFPIYCFLLVEGFQRTHSRWKYVLRLGIFALVSEIPFDLALSGSLMDVSYQNVFFTLLLGLCAMIGSDKVTEWCGCIPDRVWSRAAGYFLSGVVTAAMALTAYMLHTDYQAVGVVCIMVLYLFRSNKWGQAMAGAISFLWESTASLAFIIILCYNGKRGVKLKYIFYLFYPLHLLILYGICVWMGIGGCSVK